MLLMRRIAIVALGTMLSGCMSDGNGLDTSLNGGLGTLGGGGLGNLNLGGGVGAASLPSTDAYLKQQLERRGI